MEYAIGIDLGGTSIKYAWWIKRVILSLRENYPLLLLFQLQK